MGYLNSPYFKELYLYLIQNKLPSSKSMICPVEVLAERYIILHQGVIKTYLMIANKFFIPDLMHYLHSYIKVCYICQLSRKDKTLQGNYKKEST